MYNCLTHGLQDGTFCRICGPVRATRDQLDAVAREYADLMRALGHEVPEANIPVLRRAAAIQDAWRVAFARVLDSANDTQAKP